jgi:hypothetical protein
MVSRKPKMSIKEKKLGSLTNALPFTRIEDQLDSEKDITKR